MADYYSILKKTISGLPANSAENRKLVFAKARMAIDRQLRAINPPPSEEAISRQMGGLEAAIERIEAESTAAPNQQPVQLPLPPPVQTSIRSQQPLPPVVPVRPAQVQNPAMPSSPSMATGATMPVRAPAPVAPVRTAPAAPYPAAPYPAAPAMRAPLAGSRPAAPVRNDPPAFDSSLDAIKEIERPLKLRPAPPSSPRAPEPLRRGSGGITTLVAAIVIFGLVAGGAYALWRYQEPLLAMLGTGDPAQQTAQVDEKPATAPADGAQTDAAKEETRLGGDATAPAAKPEGTDSAEIGTPPADASQTPPETQTGTAPEAQGTVKVQPVEESGQPPAAVASEPVTPPADATQPPISGVAQKAYLYEEGTSGAGATRDDAAVIWALDQQPPADGRPAEAVIKGRLDVPGRGLVMDISIKRNVDEALPASHIIELFFQSPADFSGGSIDNVARFVMKANEQARGEGLVAVPAKIDTGYFLIALNNLEQAMATNKRLLTESSWIDIPLGYTTGRRALVTLEKGAAGDQVFRDAFADWDKR